MKNIIGVLLIVSLLIMSIAGYLNERKENIFIEDEVIIEEDNEDGEFNGHHQGILIDFDFREGTVIEINNIEAVYDYLDPHETQNYEDLITIYTTYLPMSITGIPKDFFNVNEKTIGDILSIYSIDEFIVFNDKLKNEGLTNNSIPIKVEIVSVKEKGRLLNAHVRVSYNNTTLDIEHYIDYVYIGKEAYLFVYSGEVMTYKK